MHNELDIVRDVSARLDGASLGYMLTGSGCNRAYIEQWTEELNVSKLWREVAYE